MFLSKTLVKTKDIHRGVGGGGLTGLLTPKEREKRRGRERKKEEKRAIKREL